MGKKKNKKNNRYYGDDEIMFNQDFIKEWNSTQEKKVSSKSDTKVVRKLLLNLSILNKYSINKYYIDDFACNGIITVEPITKYVLWKLAQEGKRVDEIIIIASKKAKDEKAVNGPWEGHTALEVYNNRIRGFLGERDQLRQFDEDCELPVHEEKYISQMNGIYNEGMPKFTVVPFDDGDQVDELVKLKEAIIKDADNLELYIDTQGGNRNWIFQLDAIIGMIKHDKVTIAGRYAIDFAQPNKEHQIKDVEEFYAIHELLYAFNLFKKYGIGNDLFEYFNESIDADVRAFAGHLRDAMQAISICNIAKFEAELKKTKEKETKIRYVATESKFNLIIDELYNDFKDITDADNETKKFIAMIKWCKNKQMIIQGLNIVESNLMKALIKLNELRDEGDKLIYITKNPSYYENQSLVTAEAKKSKLSEDEYLYRQLIFQIGKDIRNENLKDITSASKEQMVSFVKCFDMNEINKHGAKSGSISVDGNQDLIGYSIPAKYAESFCIFAYLYKYIKNNRNHIDHVNTDFIVKNFGDLGHSLDLLLDEITMLLDSNR